MLSGSIGWFTQMRTLVRLPGTGCSNTLFLGTTSTPTIRLGVSNSPSNAGISSRPTWRDAPIVILVSPSTSGVQPTAMQVGVDHMLEPFLISGVSFESDPKIKKMAFDTGRLIDLKSIIVLRHVP